MYINVTTTFLLTALMLTPSLAATAQEVTVGIKGGANVASTSSSLSFPKHSIGTFHVGAVVDAALGHRWSVQVQGLYNGKGYSFDAPDHSHTIRMYSLDVPVYAVYRLPHGLNVGAGPNFAVNLHGTNALSNGASGSHDYAFDGSPFDYKRFDLGVNVMVGFQSKSGVFVSGNYLKGVSDRLVNTAAPFDYTFSHNALSFSAGYMFGARK